MDTRTYSIDGDGTYRSGTNRISLQNTDITMSPIINFTLKQVRSEGMHAYVHKYQYDYRYTVDINIRYSDPSVLNAMRPFHASLLRVLSIKSQRTYHTDLTPSGVHVPPALRGLENIASTYS